MCEDVDMGGMGMPITIYEACNELFMAASVSMMMYPGLGHGAMMLIHNFGSEEQKKTYIGKMISGKWGGTMCLTEPDAGSDVGALKTKAVRLPDGTYRITGQKIFITAGDNDHYENIIHPVLARIEGDPAGTLLRADILDRGRDRSLVVILAADGEQRKQEKQIEYSVWSHISLLFTMFSSISRILHKIQILVHITQRNREKVLGR